MWCMYSNKNILYIISTVSAIEKISVYTAGFANANDLLAANDQLNFNGTITLLIAIAEETKKIDKELLKTNSEVKWQNISGMRNVLAHDYRGIDPEIVFDVIKNELPNLQVALLDILKVFPNSAVSAALDTKMYQHLKKLVL